MRLIDADHLVRLVNDATILGDGFKQAFTAIVNGEPTIDPERKTGKWIHDGYFHKGGIDWMHCSECGHKDQWGIVTRTPFCGWCGAKMEEGEQDGQTN